MTMLSRRGVACARDEKLAAQLGVGLTTPTNVVVYRCGGTESNSVFLGRHTLACPLLTRLMPRWSWTEAVLTDQTLRLQS